MADSTEGQKMDSLGLDLHNLDELIEQSTKIEDGTPTRYHLKLNAVEAYKTTEAFNTMTFGEKDKDKRHKIILMVGETGTGKTKIINAMINYMLGVQREDKVWFEVTDNQSDQTQATGQTSIITVYGFYLQESPINLTIIDTPGYGDTRGIDLDKMIAVSLLKLSNSVEMIREIDAVCLVIKATQTRLSDRQIYIFDAVQSLFGRDIAENIVLLFTHSRGAIPKNVLTAVKEAKIKCAVNDENQPVYFLFENCQSEAADEVDEILEPLWNLSFSGMTGFFKFLENRKPKSLKMTQDVLKQREQLEANILEIQSHIQNIDKKQNELKQTQEALGQQKEQVEDNTNFEDEVIYKEDVKTDSSSVASAALICTVCEENCHYPCWWISGLSWCSVIKNDHCTVCTNKCHYSRHVKGTKIYSKKKKMKQMTKEDGIASEKECDVRIEDSVSSIKKLEELQELKDKKMKQVMEAFHCVKALEMIALNTDSLFTLQHIDFLIEKLKEINEPEKAETLENIKKRAGEEKQGALEYMKRCIKSENQNTAH